MTKRTVQGPAADNDIPTMRFLEVTLSCGHIGRVSIGYEICDCCHEEEECLIIDTSDDEHGSIAICNQCRQDAYDEYAEKYQ